MKQIFILFDTDKNGIVDALELVVGLALISGMDAIEKVFFSFSVYDFDSRSALGWASISKVS